MEKGVTTVYYLLKTNASAPPSHYLLANYTIRP